MISKKIQKAFNDQINAELYSAYIYLAMSAYFEDQNFPGFAQWMKAQAGEEVEHAMKFYHHINEREGRVELQPIQGPPKKWNSPLEAFKAAYEHECYISSRINDLVKLSQAEKDYPSYSMLQWFVDEQVEEESSTKTIADQLEMIGNKSVGALFMLDRELGKRQFEMPGGDE
jgi:ferritin